MSLKAKYSYVIAIALGAVTFGLSIRELLIHKIVTLHSFLIALCVIGIFLSFLLLYKGVVIRRYAKQTCHEGNLAASKKFIIDSIVGILAGAAGIIGIIAYPEFGSFQDSCRLSR